MEMSTLCYYLSIQPTLGHFAACKVKSLSFWILIPPVSAERRSTYLSWMSVDTYYCKLISARCIVGLWFQLGFAQNVGLKLTLWAYRRVKAYRGILQTHKCMLDWQRLTFDPFWSIISCCSFLICFENLTFILWHWQQFFSNLLL